MKQLTPQEIDSMSDEEKRAYIEQRKKELGAPSREELEDLLDWVIENGPLIETDKIYTGLIDPDFNYGRKEAR